MTPTPSSVRLHRDSWRISGSCLPLPLLLLAFALTLGACAKKGPGGPGGAGFKMPPTPVEVAQVQSRTVRDQFRAIGTIQSDEIVQVVSELNAPVIRIDFAEGTTVAKGAVLARLDDREFRAAAERAEAQRELQEGKTERTAKLFERQAVSQQDVDDARAALKVAKADESLAATRLAKTRIVAPFSGLIGRRLVSAGAYLKIGDPIADLARIDAMKVSFSAPERYLPRLVPGIPVDLASPAVPGRTFTGTITVVEPIVNAGTRTVQILARIPNPHGLLRPGLSADVAVTFAERANAIVVPDEAIFAEGNQTFVYVVNPDSTVSRKAVRLGTRDSMRVEVIEGLAPDQLVVSAGHQKIFEGAHVMPIMDQPPAGAASTMPGAPARPAAQGAAATASTAREGGAATSAPTKPKGGSTKDSQ